MTTYYVDYANGNDTNNGTSLSTPFKTLTPIDTDNGTVTLQPGDTVNIRDTATVMMDNRFTLFQLAGDPNNRITIQGYQDEVPTIDFSTDPDYKSIGIWFLDCTGYIDVRNIKVQNAQFNAINVSALNGAITQSVNFYNVTMEHYGIGVDTYQPLNEARGGNGLVFFGDVRNCIVEDTIGQYGHDGSTDPAVRQEGDSDAFYIGGNGTHGFSGGHVFRRCEAYHNADDGFDFFDNDHLNPSYMYDCKAAYNGQDDTGLNGTIHYGDGNGFKTGGGWLTGGNYCIRCVSWDNDADGFDTNGASERCFFDNCTSYNNNKGFQFTGSTDPDHVVRNCISYADNTVATELYNAVSTTNTWDLGITDPSFVSTTPGASGFLELSGGSPCIDVGTDIGYSFLGSAPDLGAYEFGTGTPTFQGSKATALASLKEPLGVSEFSGTILSKAEMTAPTANVTAVGNHTASVAIVDKLTTTTYYIDPLNGSNSNTGVQVGEAFADFTPLQNIGLGPGDIVRVRDTANINLTSGVAFSNLTGNADQPIIFEAYEDENPVLDGTGMSGSAMFRLTSCSNVQVRDLKLQNAPSSGLVVDGTSSSFLLQDVEVDTFGVSGAGSGIVLTNAGTTGGTVRSCIAHHGSWQGTSDGFAVTDGSGGHTFENCTAYRNCDDGFGMYDADGLNPCSFIKCNAYLNGNNGSGVTGDGNGFKAGGALNTGGHTFTQCKAWDNTRRGFECADVDIGCTVRNCTTFSNDIVGFRDNVGLSTFQNNLAWSDAADTSFLNSPTETTNSWNLAIGDPTFVSTTYAEGSVGATFLRLNTGSPAINVGTDIGLPYSGASPDLGAHEFGATGTTYYVDPVAGSDSNNGLTTGAAFKTLAPFDTATGTVTLANADQIEVRSGTVEMQQILNISADAASGQEIVFTNYAAETPTVTFDGVSGQRAINLTGSYLTFDGIDFDVADRHMFYLDGATNITIENCTVSEAGKGGVVGAGVYTTNTSSVTLNSVVSRDNLGNGLYVGPTSTATASSLDTLFNGSDGIKVASTASTVTITGGTAMGNTGAGLDADSTVTLKQFKSVENTGDGINVNDTVAATLHNNTAYENGGTGVVVAGAAHDLTNNLTYENDTAQFSGDGSQSETTNSWNLVPANPDPRFMSITYGDSQFLQPYGLSDVIDAGTDVSLAFNDAAPDLGAVEGTLIEQTGSTTENGYNLSPTAGTRDLESFEAGFSIANDLDGDTANFGFETNGSRVHDGTQSLETTAAGDWIAWYSDTYSGEKETYAGTTYTSWHWGWNGVWTGVAFMADTASTGEADFSGYVVSILSRGGGSNDELELIRYDNGTPTVLDSHIAVDFITGQSSMHRVDFDVDTSGNITVDFYDAGSATVTQTLTATDTTYKTGRLGFYGNGSSACMDDTSANSTQTGSEPPLIAEHATATSDGITAQSQIVLGGQAATANADVKTATVEVKPIGQKFEVVTDTLQAAADLAVFGSLVQSQAAMSEITAADVRSVLFGVKATAGSDMLAVTASPEPVASFAESTSGHTSPTTQIAVSGSQAVSEASVMTPLSKLFVGAEMVVANSAIKPGQPTVIAIAEKAEAEAVSKAVGADVTVLVDSIEALASEVTGTAHVAAQGTTTAILMEVVDNSSRVTAVGDTATANASATDVSVEVVAISDKVEALGDYEPANLTSIAAHAFAVKARAQSQTANTSNVTASGNKVKTEAGTFANSSNLNQFNTFYTNGSAIRTIASKGSKQ